MMKRLFLTLLFGAALFGQESVSRVLKLTYIEPDSTRPVLDILAGGKVRWNTDSKLHVIALLGPQDLVDAIEATIKKLDIPPAAAKNIELTFHILLASATAGQTNVPAELSSVVQQLGTVFGMKSFRVLETAVIRGREGRPAETSGLVALQAKVDISPQYFIKCRNMVTTPSEKGLRVRLDNLEFRVSIPTGYGAKEGLSWASSGVTTDVDVREGQKVVVGKSGLDTPAQSVFLVVSAKVID